MLSYSQSVSVLSYTERTFWSVSDTYVQEIGRIHFWRVTLTKPGVKHTSRIDTGRAAGALLGLAVLIETIID